MGRIRGTRISVWVAVTEDCRIVVDCIVEFVVSDTFCLYLCHCIVMVERSLSVLSEKYFVDIQLFFFFADITLVLVVKGKFSVFAPKRQ